VGFEIGEEARPVLIRRISDALDRFTESCSLACVIWNEAFVAPVGFEFRCKTREHMGHVLSRDLYGPLQATGHRGLAHVGGADVGSRVAARAVEVICLGVKAGPSGVV